MNRWTIAELKTHLAIIERQLLDTQERRQCCNALTQTGKSLTMRYNRLSAQRQDYVNLIAYAEGEE